MRAFRPTCFGDAMFCFRLTAQDSTHLGLRGCPAGWQPSQPVVNVAASDWRKRGFTEEFLKRPMLTNQVARRQQKNTPRCVECLRSRRKQNMSMMAQPIVEVLLYVMGSTAKPQQQNRTWRCQSTWVVQQFTLLTASNVLSLK